MNVSLGTRRVVGRAGQRANVPDQRARRLAVQTGDEPARRVRDRIQFPAGTFYLSEDNKDQVR